MSGAVAAHAAYNGSGTQGLAVTNKITGNEGDVMSVFWNKNDTTRQLLFGSTFVEIQSSGASSTDFIGSSRLFTVNNDIDCLGDVYLQIGLGGTATIAPNAAFWVLNLIDRIEIQVGTQIWQTIDKTDIRSILATELPEGSFDNFFSNTLKSGNIYFLLPSLFNTLSSPLTSYTNHVEDGYLMAAAPHQQVKIKVSFNSKATASVGISDITITDCKLFGKHQIMCNEEREQIKSMMMGIPKRLKMTQNVVVSGITSQAVTVDLDQFSLYGSHLVITGNVFTSSALTLPTAGIPIAANNNGNATTSVHYVFTLTTTLAADLKLLNDAYVEVSGAQVTGAGPFTATGNSTNYASGPTIFRVVSSSVTSATTIGVSVTFGLAPLNSGIPLGGAAVVSGGAQTGATFKLIEPHYLQSAELKLNSSSFSGLLPGVLLESCTADTMGLYSNCNLTEMDKTTLGTVAVIHRSDFGNVVGDMGTYVFPLASTAYSGSAVPLNRFDSIRLALTFSGTPTGGYVGVTCAGETTALYKGGAASLAMY
jgi:hypothetical protein